MSQDEEQNQFRTQAESVNLSSPVGATNSKDLGFICCKVRRAGGLKDFDVPSQLIPVEALVSACDWILARHANGLTIRGCPVSIGSPLAVAVKTAGPMAFVAGSALELDLPNPERYKSGKAKLSVLILGFYCSKKKYDSEGAVFHVSYTL